MVRKCKRKPNRKAAIVTVTFGGAVLCFCFMSAQFLVVTLAVALIALGIWLLRC